MKYLFALFVVILLVGCAPKEQLVGNDKDEHGCIPSAGYSWCEAKQKCLRVWEEPCATNSSEHICTAEESTATACTMEYAPVCGKIVLNMGDTVYKTFGNGCAACASLKTVSYTPGKCADDTIVDTCSDQNGNSLTLNDAITIALSSECGDNLSLSCSCPDGYRKDGDACNPECYYSKPACMMPSKICEKTYFCNEGTGTYWINLNITKEGCNPACVVNIADKTAEINWRCTGLIVP
jgi:hypothetical protein